jgi:uncharacterized membrane protein YqjE
VGGLVGLLAGAVAAHRAQPVLIAAASVLLAAAGFTVLEEPLTEVRVLTFAENHPLADLAAKVAAVLLLAGLAGILARRDRDATPPMPVRDLEGALPQVPTPTIAAVLAVTLLAALVLWQIGDRRWEGTALAVAVALLVLAAVLAIARLRRRLRAGPH